MDILDLDKLRIFFKQNEDYFDKKVEETKKDFKNLNQSFSAYKKDFYELHERCKRIEEMHEIILKKLGERWVQE